MSPGSSWTYGEILRPSAEDDAGLGEVEGEVGKGDGVSNMALSIVTIIRIGVHDPFYSFIL